ncbi:unnamed protein product [Discosporangium mesarthrocarpum]
MVLQELGGKLTSALRRLHTETVVDDEVVKAVVGDICRALLEADVNVQMVVKLRKNVEAKARLAESSNAGAAQRRSIQKTVMDELTAMLDPKTSPYKMKKGKSNVIMFVGLQVTSPLNVDRHHIHAMHASEHTTTRFQPFLRHYMPTCLQARTRHTKRHPS